MLVVERVMVTSQHEHLSAAIIAALIDRTLPPDRRADAELHLSGCRACREELASCARLASSLPARAPWRASGNWGLTAIGVAAAAVVIAIAVRPRASSDDSAMSRERAPADSRSSIATVLPTNDARVARADLRFVWRLESRSTGYHVTVIDANGARVWEADVADTSVAPPPTARLRTGARYYWRVETVRADGTTAQSSTPAFQLTP